MNDSMQSLWTEKYQPTLDNLLQPRVRCFLQEATGITSHLMLFGPAGAGKTAAARAYADAVHANPEYTVVTLNVADVFDRSRSELREDPRFERFIEAEYSKREILFQALQKKAGYAGVVGDHSFLLLDNMEAVREDLQWTLRRLMEQYSEVTQFVITTRQRSKLLPAVRSPCIPVPVPTPSDDVLCQHLAEILEAESVSYQQSALRVIVERCNGNIRKALITTQTVAVEEGVVTQDAVVTLDKDSKETLVESLLETALDGQFIDAREQLHNLLIDEGLQPDEVLRLIVHTGVPEEFEMPEARLVRMVGAVDARLVDAANAHIQLAQLLSQLASWKQNPVAGSDEGNDSVDPPDPFEYKQTDATEWYEIELTSMKLARLVRQADNVDRHEFDDGRMKTLRLPVDTAPETLDQISEMTKE